MNFCLATCTTLFLLFSAASCAPAAVGLQDACADVKSSSLELNRIARNVSVEARNGSRDILGFPTRISWMEAKDMCDPEALKQKPAPCLGKMLNVLKSYNSAVMKLSSFQSCTKFAKQVMPAVQGLHEDMSRCVKSKAGIGHQKAACEYEDASVQRWEEELLCFYTLDRLFSFSILAARVFAVGDPAHHALGSPQMCAKCCAHMQL